MKTTTQNQTILKMLKQGPVTPLDALNEAGCFRLAARIHDLRSDGHVIDTERVRHLDGKQYARYYLVQEAGDDLL